MILLRLIWLLHLLKELEIMSAQLNWFEGSSTSRRMKLEALQTLVASSKDEKQLSPIDGGNSTDSSNGLSPRVWIASDFLRECSACRWRRGVQAMKALPVAAAFNRRWFNFASLLLLHGCMDFHLAADERSHTAACVVLNLSISGGVHLLC